MITNVLKVCFRTGVIRVWAGSWSEFDVADQSLVKSDQSLIKSDQSLHSQDSSEFTRGKSSEADILQGRIEADEWFADYGN